MEELLTRILEELVQVNVSLGSLVAMEEERREAERPMEALTEAFAKRAGVPDREEPPVNLHDLPFYKTSTGGYLIRNPDGSSRPPDDREAAALAAIGQKRRR